MNAAEVNKVVALSVTGLLSVSDLVGSSEPEPEFGSVTTTVPFTETANVPDLVISAVMEESSSFWVLTSP